MDKVDSAPSELSASQERATKPKTNFRSLFQKNLKQVGMTTEMPMPSQEAETSLKWKESFPELLKNQRSLCAFREFLISEYCEENLAFYMACDDYMKTQYNNMLLAKARKIYDEFICCSAPREINIDHSVRAITEENMKKPTIYCFEMARRQIYTLMEKHCYPRFLKSPAYQDLCRQLAG